MAAYKPYIKDTNAVIHCYWRGNGKYDPSVHPLRCIEMGKLGYTKARMASEFGVSKKQLWVWTKEREEFAEAMDIAMTHAQARAEEDLDKLALGESDGNVQAQIFKMELQFKKDYTKVKKIDKTNTVKIQTLPDEQLNKQIAAKLKLLSPEERKAMLPVLGHTLEGEFKEVVPVND